MKHIPISVGFAIITLGQLVLGVWMVTLAGIKGGTVQLPNRKNNSHSESLPSLRRSCLLSPTPAASATRCVPLVRVSST